MTATTPVRPPFPKRLIVAALGLIGLAGVTAVLALVAGYAAAVSVAPLPPILGLAGPAAGLMLLTAIFILARERWGQALTAILVVYSIALGLTIGSSGWLYIVAFLIVGIIVGSVDAGVFPGGPWLPRTRVVRLVVVVLAVGAVVVAVPLLLADPLKPSDLRTPSWAGVIASAERRDLTDGRRFGQPAEYLERGASDGDLVLGGGSVELPTWVWTVSPADGEPGCFKTRDLGYDDGQAVVIRVSRAGAYVGMRIGKAPGFTADPATDGRYVWTRAPIRDERMAVAMEARDRGVGVARSLPPPGFFCLDAKGQVTKWDQGY